MHGEFTGPRLVSRLEIVRTTRPLGIMLATQASAGDADRLMGNPLGAKAM